MYKSTTGQVGTALVQEANTADDHGQTAVIHVANLPPIELHGQVSTSRCGSVAFVPGSAGDKKAASTWIIPIANLQAVEIRGQWMSDQQSPDEGPSPPDQPVPEA